MKKLLLIFIFAIGIASNASAHRDTVIYQLGTTVVNGTPLASGSATLIVNVGDTIVFQSLIGGPVDYLVNTTPFIGITGSQYFQYKVVGSDVPSFNVTVTYMTFTQPVISVTVNNVGVGIKDKLKPGNFITYPNPVIDKLFFSSPNNLGKITITNLIGQAVYNATCNDKQTSIDVSALPQGAYIVNVGGVFKKIIKE